MEINIWNHSGLLLGTGCKQNLLDEKQATTSWILWLVIALFAKHKGYF